MPEVSIAPFYSQPLGFKLRRCSSWDLTDLWATNWNFTYFTSYWLSYCNTTV